MSLAFLSLASVGVKTSSHLSDVISSCPTDLVISLLDDHSDSLWARTIPPPRVGSCPPEISAPETFVYSSMQESEPRRSAARRRIFS